jgi:hypothetical protein
VQLSGEQVRDFNIALNEAELVGAEVNVSERLAGLTLAVLSLPADDGPEPDDPRVQVILESLGRVVASLRHGRWDDESARAELFAVDQLNTVVGRCGQLPMYGWEFLDVPDEDSFDRWRDRLSLNWEREPTTANLTRSNSQESSPHLDMRFWFDEIRIFRPNGQEVAFDDFPAGGVRWWDALDEADLPPAGSPKDDDRSGQLRQRRGED